MYLLTITTMHLSWVFHAEITAQCTLQGKKKTMSLEGRKYERGVSKELDQHTREPKKNSRSTVGMCSNLDYKQECAHSKRSGQGCEIKKLWQSAKHSSQSYPRVIISQKCSSFQTPVSVPLLRSRITYATGCVRLIRHAITWPKTEI